MTANRAFDVIMLCSCTEILIGRYYLGGGGGEEWTGVERKQKLYSHLLTFMLRAV